MRVKKGFTLVELLVVIGIITVLISLLLPALNRATRSAHNVACLSNLRQIGQLINMYVIANRQALPMGSWNGGYSGSPRATDWSFLIGSMIDNTSDATSSTANRTAEDSNGRRIFQDYDTIGDIGLSTSQNTLHYSAHPRLMPNISGPNTSDPYTSDYPVAGSYPTYRMGSILRPSEVVLIMDGAQVVSNSYNAVTTAYGIDRAYSYDSVTRFDTAPFLNYDDPAADNGDSVNGQINIDPPSYEENDGGIRWRHLNNTSANFLFVDGHCESLKWKNGSHTDLRRANVNVNIAH